MHDLEKKIADWRARLAAVLPANDATVRELEDHLRDNIEALQRTGVATDEAFARSVQRLGDEAEIAREFSRVDSRWLPASTPVLVILTVLAAAIVIQLGLIGRIYLGLKINLLLAVHVSLVASGYLLVLGTGLIGALALVTARRRPLGTRERRELQHVIRRLTTMSAGLILSGMGLGMLWAADYLGRFWSWHPREIGAMLVLGSTVLSRIVQTRAAVDDRVRWFLATLGIPTVLVGWFGANALTATGPFAWLCAAIIAGQISVVMRRPRHERSGAATKYLDPI